MEINDSCVYKTTTNNGEIIQLKMEDIYCLYVTKNLTKLQIAEMLDVTEGKISWALKKWKITKAPDVFAKSKSTTYRICKEDFYQLYIEENKTIDELSEYFGCSRTVIKSRIKEWGMHKPKELVQQNIERAFLNNYGVTNCLKSQVIRGKIKGTSLSKYGVENPMQNDEIKKKAAVTNLNKYGTVMPLNNEEVKEKAQNTMLQKYGSPYYKTSLLSDIAKEVFLTDKNFMEYIKSSKLFSVTELSKALECNRSTVVYYLNKYALWNLIDSHSSAAENEIGEFLDSLKITHYKSRKIIPPKEIDHYCPDFNLGIEFNGNFYHSSIMRQPTYHQQKSLEALSKGVFIYHIFEYEWSSSCDRERITKDLHRLFTSYDKLPDNKDEPYIQVNITKNNILPYLHNGYYIDTVLPPIPHYCTYSGDMLSEEDAKHLKYDCLEIYDCGDVVLRMGGMYE